MATATEMETYRDYDTATRKETVTEVEKETETEKELNLFRLSSCISSEHETQELSRGALPRTLCKRSCYGLNKELYGSGGISPFPYIFSCNM